jgi:hypothetical protein
MLTGLFGSPELCTIGVGDSHWINEPGAAPALQGTALTGRLGRHHSAVLFGGLLG